MKIKPLGDRVLIKPSEEKEKTKGGIVLPDTAKEKPQEGKIVAVGEGRKTEDGKTIPLTLKVGDRVLYGKYSGTEITIDGEEYLIMREEDVLAVIFTIIYNKVKKYAIVLKDVKILLDPKVLDFVSDLVFTERYELDLARKINTDNDAFIHYYEDFDSTVYKYPILGWNKYDLVVAYNDGDNPTEKAQYVFFAAYWPNATEYSVYSDELVPNFAAGKDGVLAWGTAVADIPKPPTGPGEPSTPWVVVQWHFNNTISPDMMVHLKNVRHVRFVEVIGMTDRAETPLMTQDADDTGTDEPGDEVRFLVNNEVFNPEDLNSIRSAVAYNGRPFMWLALGQSAATTDSGGGALVTEWLSWFAFVLFDKEDLLFPWIAPVVTMKSSIPYGLHEFDGDYLDDLKRTALKKFAFDVYDDDKEKPPQPIAGGWSYYHKYWYPSMNPLNGRLDSTLSPAPYTDLHNPEGIMSIAGVKANWITRYFNDFSVVITREGTDYYALVDGGTISGSAPTSDPDLPTLDFFPLTCYRVDLDTFGYKEGYAVISLVRDINGTRGLLIYGWDGRDTFWAAAWASLYVSGAFVSPWLPAGTVALVLKIEYNDNMEPIGFTVVEALGTITELEITSVPKGTAYYTEVWWFSKLPTNSTAKIHWDP